MSRTLIIVKPDATAAGNAGAILSVFEQAGLRIAALRLARLSKEEAKAFYIVHKERPFYDSLTTFMSSGTCIPAVLEGEDIVRRVRDLMGATNPAQAAEGTIRKRYATNIERNAVHGSDSPESAAYEIGFFFSGRELLR
ncbi:MAG: nucleoside-diphosphate kinase [Candidatus Schekmanbacteria bacterium]|nr:nucleoside-diphosphate kinase [Candidatus Schekmanbacteria bacterium]